RVQRPRQRRRGLRLRPVRPVVVGDRRRPGGARVASGRVRQRPGLRRRGWDEAGDASSGVYAYDPSSDSWSQKADLPEDISAASAAVLQGQLYVVGGCTTGNCAPTSSKVYRYDAGSDSWTAVADYPEKVAFTACAGVAGEVVCAGGVNADTNVPTTHTYAYDPGSDSWTQVADMPADLWASAASGAGNKLQVSSGVMNNS